MKIAIAACVRDCLATLPIWLEYHRSLGISRFYLADHQPSDCSPYLRSQPDVVHLVKTGRFEQSAWTAELVNLAIRDNFQVVFTIDADEFVLTQDLRAHIAPYAATGKNYIIRMPGFNMVPDSPDSEWWQTTLGAAPAFGSSKAFVVVGNQKPLFFKHACCHLPIPSPPENAVVLPNSHQNPGMIVRDPSIAPVFYGHFSLVGKEAFMHKIRNFTQSYHADGILQRFGAFSFDEEKLKSKDFSKEDHQKFLSDISDPVVSSKIYREQCLSAILKCHVFFPWVRRFAEHNKGATPPEVSEEEFEKRVVALYGAYDVPIKQRWTKREQQPHDLCWAP